MSTDTRSSGRALRCSRCFRYNTGEEAALPPGQAFRLNCLGPHDWQLTWCPHCAGRGYTCYCGWCGLAFWSGHVGDCCERCSGHMRERACPHCDPNISREQRPLFT